MEKKSYKITFGLKEGYSKNGRVHKLATAEKIIKKWMDEQIYADRPIVCGLLQDGKLFFPLTEKGGGPKIIVSHSAIFFGELSSREDMKRKDGEIKNTLEDLAFKIKEQLKQESVFIIYKDKNWSV